MVRRSLAAHTADQTLPQARLAEDQHSIQAHCQLAKGFALDIPSSRRLREGGE